MKHRPEVVQEAQQQRLLALLRDPPRRAQRFVFGHGQEVFRSGPRLQGFLGLEEALGHRVVHVLQRLDLAHDRGLELGDTAAVDARGPKEATDVGRIVLGQSILVELQQIRRFGLVGHHQDRGVPAEALDQAQPVVQIALVLPFSRVQDEHVQAPAGQKELVGWRA